MRLSRYFMVNSALLCMTTAAEAFSIFSPTKNSANPALKTFPEVATGSQFDIHLGVTSSNDSSSRMSVTGLTLELHNVEPFYAHPKLPGVDGPNPKLSTGAKALRILKDGSFVGTQGLQYVDFVNGCWELVWKDGVSSGSLICGFDLHNDVTRNDVTLAKGRIYLSFPVWDKAKLSELQRQKTDVQALADACLAEKDSEMRKYQDEPNPLMKALHYHNAAVASVKYQDSGVMLYAAVPELSDVVAIKESEFLVTTKGLMWTKDGSFHRGTHALLGTATLKVVPS